MKEGASLEIQVECENCHEDCYNCDHLLLHWQRPRTEELKTLRRMKEKAISRLQREINEIDQELYFLENNAFQRGKQG